MTEASPPRSGKDGARWSDLTTRAASALVLVALAVLTARGGGVPFILFWLLATLAIHWEWQRLLAKPAFGARFLVGAAILILVAVLARVDLLEAFLVLLLGTGAFVFIGGPERRIWAASGLAYAGVFLLAVLSLRFSFPYGSRSIFWLFATVWATDTCAYFGGRLIGGPKIWPRISPKKTWSGTLTGLVFGTLIGTFVVLRDLPPPHGVGHIVLITLAAAFWSQIGDAFESAMKRHFGVKDSSRIIPGHGGVMDRLDGFVVAAVFAFLFGLARTTMPSIASGLFYWP